jgi:hypothetical protein
MAMEPILAPTGFFVVRVAGAFGVVTGKSLNQDSRFATAC